MSQRTKFQQLPFGPEMTQRWVAVGVYLIACVLIAYVIAVQNYRMVYLFAVFSLGFLTMFGLKRRAWVLILLAWSLSGYTAILAVPIAVRDIAVLLAAGSYLTYRVVAGQPTRRRLCLLDVMICVNIVYVVFTFMIHPVGFLALGSETLGARTYWNIGLALVAYWVIWRVPESPKLVSRTPIFILIGVAAASSMSLVAFFFPNVASQLPFLYAAIDLDAYLSAGDTYNVINRVSQLGALGMPLVQCFVSYYPPAELFNVLRLRFYGLMLGFVCILASGYRSMLAVAFASTAIATWLHRGWRAILLTGAAIVLLLTPILLGQGRLFDLPLAAQRALSFLPGRWSEVVMLDVEASSENRFQWWRTVLKEGLIENIWFGDGFGTSKQDLIMTLGAGRFVERTLLSGEYHSGPLTTLRYAGIVGLVFFYALMISSAVYGYQCVKKCKGTMLQPAAIFIAIQLIWAPVHFTLIFGSFNTDMPQQIFLAGVLRLLLRMSDELAPEPLAMPVESSPEALRGLTPA